jgi:hypothetical protein
MAVAATILTIYSLVILFREKASDSSHLLPSQRLTISFLITSYVIWLFTSSILRYAIVVEVLSVLVSLILIHRIAYFRPNKNAEIIALVLGLTLCTFSLVTTRSMDWGHVRFGKKVFDVDMNWVEPNTLFISVNGPTAYLAAFVPEEKNARFVGLSFMNFMAKDGQLDKITKDIVKAHLGQIIVLIPDGAQDVAKNLPVIGLSAHLGACRLVHSNLDEARGEAILACLAEKATN